MEEGIGAERGVWSLRELVQGGRASASPEQQVCPRLQDCGLSGDCNSAPSLKTRIPITRIFVQTGFPAWPGLPCLGWDHS